MIGKVRSSSARLQTVHTRRANGTYSHTEETKKKISESGLKIGHLISTRQIGKKRSEETKQKMRDFYLKNPDAASAKKSKLVVNLETGIFYQTTREAGRTIGMNYGRLSERLRGITKNKTSFRYA